ncbi:centrosomal protein of 290 kDa-like [Littorina saxatilis]|uniref:centrosomal protein of 290 kDa-like n=1 Tax=Littorina saxatilis TaxID=31220 RepID=UPI0038B597D2
MVRELEDGNEQLKQEIKDLNRDLNAEKRAAEKYSERISELEKELKDLRDDNDQLRQDLSDYKMQVQAQRENIVSQQGDDMGFREKLARKNHELAEAMEELQNLTDTNEMLQQRCDDLQKNLEDAVTQMDRTTEDYVKLKAVLQQSDSVTDRLREENEILKAQVQDLTEQVQSKSEADDAIMVAVNNKIEEWQEVVGQKDQQLAELQEQMFRMREQLIAANMDSDKASITALTQVLKEKDQQIEELTAQTNQYISEMEASAAMVEDLRAELSRAGAGGGDRYQNKIRELQKELGNVKEHLKNTEEDAKKAEEDAKAKDKELNEALERMQQYERGEYGLEEAVMEIKEKKTQVNVRDRQIEELTQYINKAELKINEILDENEELRYRLGMDPRAPLDLTEFRKNKAIRQEEEKALNFILQRQIEQLEEERVNDKQKIRKLGQQLGKRAVELGLTAQDMVAVQDYTDTLRTKRKVEADNESPAIIIRREVQKQESQMRNHELDKDYRQNLVEMTQMDRELAELRSQTKQLEQDNQHLEAGLKEVMEALQQRGGHPTTPRDAGESEGLDGSRFPAIERMLAAIEAKRVIGNYDTSLYLKEQVDVLRGRNEEIRSELRQARVESTKMHLERDKAFEKIEKLQKDQGIMSESGAVTGIVQAIPLPEGMAPTSAEVIASLNEHLVITLQELSRREESMHKMEKSLENYKRKFAVMRHQQGLLYQQYLTDTKEWKDSAEKLQKQLREIQGSREEDLVKIAEFDRLVDTLSHDDVEVRRRLSEMTRRMTVLRVNEKALIRRYTTMEEMEDTLRKENNRLRNEMNQLESAISERMGYLQRYKDMASFKIAGLQRAVEESVPQADLDKVNKEYHQVTEKYRDLLEKGNSLVSKAEALTGLESEVKQLTVENEELKSTMKMEKERLHALEAAMEELHRRGVTDGTDVHVTDADIISISKKLTMLEMKELNERQRAEHAVRMYDQQRHLLGDLESRNKELEDKFAEITKMNLEMQKTERELRDELANSVTKTVSDADRKRISELDHTELTLRQEISKLKDVADISSTQVRTLEVQHVSHEKENKSLRQQLLDFQVQSDEKTIIGKLHRTIVQLQISESTAVKQLEASRKRLTQLEAGVLRLEQKVDSKEQSLYHSRQESQSKVRYLKRNLQELRLQFAGAVPLSKQEKFSKNMVQLQQDKAKMELELRGVRKQREETEDKVAELSQQREGLQELIQTLKDGRGASKVAEWHSKMDSVRLEELRQRRNNVKLNQQIKYLEEIIRSHEVSIAELEADNVRLLKEFEERQMRWEQREGELERNILTMEKQTAEITGAAARFEQALGSLPDAKLPVANQLEQAISTIKTNVKVILDTQANSKALKAKVQELERLLKDSERTLIEREKLISELRLRMPATTDRDTIIERATAKVSEAMSRTAEPDYETQQGMKVAQSTVHSLQQRIQQKEETIVKYQELLNQARQDMMDMNRRHEQELKAMQFKLHAASDVAFSKFKQAANDLINKHTASRRQPISEKQLERLTEVEDTVAEQENTIVAMNEKLKQKEEQIIRLRAEMATAVKHVKTEKIKLKEEQTTYQSKRSTEHDDLQRVIGDQRKEIRVLNEEIAALKDSNTRGPTASMKSLVERLKNQLALKEKQHQALSKALTDLRADMVAQAQNNVISHAEDAQQERNIQRLIDSHTKDISEQLEDVQSQLERSKRELKKRKEGEGLLQTEMEDVKEELSRKERAISKLKNTKAKLETEVDELERKLERFGSQKSQVQQTGDVERIQELEDMRRRNRYLEEELKRKHTAEKPYEQKEEKSKMEEALRWEESKKWQRTIDKMKSKIKEKDDEIEKLSRTVERLKATLDRTHKEKDALESKTKVISRTAAPALGAAPRSHPDHDKEDLRQINFRLEEEIRELKKHDLMSRDAGIKEVQMRNTHLREQIEQLERALAHRPKEGGVDVNEYQRLFEKNQELQREVLRLSEESMELRFEVEAARKDVPRMKERISDLQKYVEALKHENAHLSGDSARSAASSIRRFGESGKSTRELEKTIALLKKVVERVQQENEKLKKAPGVVGGEQIALLKRENEGLKDQMGELRQQVGATLSERYTSQQKGTAKMMNDYEQMRKELAKERETNEKLRVQLRNVELRGEQSERELLDTKTKLEIEAAKRPSSTSIANDQQGWKSAVITRTYEEKIKALEADNEKKAKQISDVKILLRDAAEREQRLLQENQELQQKVAVLERFPSGSQVTDSNIMREYQQARLQIERLENEKKELVNDLRLAQQRRGGTGEEVTSDIMMKARKYEEMAKENVESRLEVKSVNLDNHKLRLEVERMTKELQSFGPDFFEEIEDLKYNYKQTVERCKLVEERLRLVARQFGVATGVSGLD